MVCQTCPSSLERRHTTTADGQPHTRAPSNTTEQSHAPPCNLVEIRYEEEIKAEGREVLQQALNEGLDCKEIAGKLVIGNRRNLDLAAEISRRFAALENQQASRRMAIEAPKKKNIQQAETYAALQNALNELARFVEDLTIEHATLRWTISSQVSKICTLKGRLVDLALESEGYNQVRQCFFSMYKRKAHMALLDEDLRIIGESNGIVHFSDAFADAWLYSLGSWCREEVFRALYWLNTEAVPLFGKCFPSP